MLVEKKNFVCVIENNSERVRKKSEHFRIINQEKTIKSFVDKQEEETDWKKTISQRK